MFLRISTIIILSVLFKNITNAQNNRNYKLVNTFHIASGGGWDYIAVNDNKIYTSHGSQVNILNEETGDSLGFIPNTTGVHGIAFDNALGRGYTSNGRLNSVTVFDLKTNAAITQIQTGRNPDAIMYEPFSKMIITNNGGSNNLSIIDPQKNMMVDSVDLGGQPEEAISDEKGKLYVNLEDKNEIAVVDLKTYKVIARWSLLPGEGPSGVAIDNKTNRLFSACSDSKLLVVMDASNGKIIDKLPIGEGCDGIAFDANTNMIFVPNGRDATITAYIEESANKYKSLGNIETKIGARTITIDNKTGALFLPTAEFAPADPQNPTARRQMKPETFQVLKINK